MQSVNKLIIARAVAVCLSLLPAFATGQPFIHPGINQNRKDLVYMKQMVLSGKQPWKAAFDRLKTVCDTNFIANTHTHVLRGPYGKPNIGGDDLSKGANMAYNYALVWYITNDRSYASKAIAILNAWSPVIWDLDYNDAKLLAAWTGHLFCNAAEILRATNSGWQQKDIAAFSNMLMTVYYPLLRPYYPQANGNWDGAIIHSILAIAIFTDNRSLFQNALDHFKYAPVNGSIFKYIYPNGQCQETARDHGHVQLGIGEFAGAAQVAFTQGVDLFSIGGNRIARGFEYEAGILLGQTPYCYCQVSDRAKNLRDDYEYVYRHYTAAGLDLPFVKMAADSIRSKASRGILSSVRAGSSNPIVKTKKLPGIEMPIAGAGSTKTVTIPEDAIIIAPGQPVQDAFNAAAGSGKWVVLKTGIHKFPHTLHIPSGITIAGEGAGTILFLDPGSGDREAMVNAAPDMHDVTIRNLVIEAGSRTDPGTDPNTYRSFKGGYNRAGILLRSEKEMRMQRLHFNYITVRNATYSGVSISGATDIDFNGCDFNENGATVPSGPKLLHNLLLSHCSQVAIKDSRMDTSPNGAGLAIDHCSDLKISGSEIARNGYYGILITESKNLAIDKNLIEANDRSGILAEFLFSGNDKISINNNILQYNNGYGLESYGSKNLTTASNTYEGNAAALSQQKTSAEKHIVVEP